MLDNSALVETLQALGKQADAKRDAQRRRVRRLAKPPTICFNPAELLQSTSRQSWMESSKPSSGTKETDLTLSPDSIMDCPERTRPQAPLDLFSKDLRHGKAPPLPSSGSPVISESQLVAAVSLANRKRETNTVRDPAWEGFYERPAKVQQHFSREAESYSPAQSWCLEAMVNMVERMDASQTSYSTSDMLDVLDILEMEDSEEKQDEEDYATPLVAGHRCSVLPILGVSKGRLPWVDELPHTMPCAA